MKDLDSINYHLMLTQKYLKIVLWGSLVAVKTNSNEEQGIATFTCFSPSLTTITLLYHNVYRE